MKCVHKWILISNLLLLCLKNALLEHDISKFPTADTLILWCVVGTVLKHPVPPSFAIIAFHFSLMIVFTFAMNKLGWCIWYKVFKNGLSKFFKGCLALNLFSPLLNTLPHNAFCVIWRSLWNAVPSKVNLSILSTLLAFIGCRKIFKCKIRIPSLFLIVSLAVEKW